MSSLNLNIELYSHPINFPQNKAETNAIRKVFYQIAFDWHENIRNNFFNVFNDLDDLYNKSDSYANQVRHESISQAMKFLAAHEIYDMTEQQFYQNFMIDYDTWDEDFNIIASKYEAIVERTEDLHAYRTARRQSRDKWVGYNARGQGEAFAKNITSNIGHGVFNLAAAGFNAIGDSIKKNDIFKSPSTLNQVAEGLYNIVIAAFEATIDAINSEIGNKFHKYSNEEASKVEAIVEGISSGRIPEDKILPSLIKAIHLYPYNRDTYILFLSNFGDHDRSLEAIMNYFGITSLSNEKKKIFELKRSKFSLISLEDCKTNLPTLEDYAQSIGYEEFKEESKKLLETAKKQEFEKRLTFYKDHFWLMFEEEKLIAFVDGMVTNQEDLTDEMYEKAEMHDEKGDWQMIFGVNTLPSYRKHGYAGELIKRAITDAKEQGRKGLVLTCKDRLLSYYARFGFKNEGVSESVHGNVVWNQMRLTFDEGLGE